MTQSWGCAQTQRPGTGTAQHPKEQQRDGARTRPPSKPIGLTGSAAFGPAPLARSPALRRSPPAPCTSSGCAAGALGSNLRDTLPPSEPPPSSSTGTGTPPIPREAQPEVLLPAPGSAPPPAAPSPPGASVRPSVCPSVPAGQQHKCTHLRRAAPRAPAGTAPPGGTSPLHRPGAGRGGAAGCDLGAGREVEGTCRGRKGSRKGSEGEGKEGEVKGKRTEVNEVKPNSKQTEPK